MIDIETAREYIVDCDYTDEEIQSILTSLYLLTEVVLDNMEEGGE